MSLYGPLFGAIFGPLFGGSVPVVVVTPTSPTPILDRGAYDWRIDPKTLDFVDDDIGGWQESSDSQAAVMFQLECDYLAWWGDPHQGTRYRTILRNGGKLLDIEDDTRRAMQLLVNDGRISDLNVASDRDESGRGVIVLAYTDRLSGRRVEESFVPFGG